MEQGAADNWWCDALAKNRGECPGHMCAEGNPEHSVCLSAAEEAETAEPTQQVCNHN